jgi:LPS-assembly lipoprotein
VWKKLLTVLFIAQLLASCGYHLRGAYDLPKEMHNIFLQGGSGNLHEQFLSSLKSSGGQLVNSPDKADMVIVVVRDTIERRTLSLSERGRSNEIELAGSLEFELRDAKNHELLPRETLTFRREYFNDQQDVIAKDNEESVIRNEMYQQVVATIINRGRTALASKPK